MIRINRDKQLRAVQRYFRNLPYGDELLVCLDIMTGVPEEQICKKLHMNKKAWLKMKKTISDGLKESGVRVRN